MSVVRTAEILAVGSELLTPWRTDTNSLFLTGRLNDLGIEVVGKAVAGDDQDRLTAAVRAALARADVLILTGGLGPTGDDLTREAVAAALQIPLEESPDALAAVAARFAARGVSMPPINRRQAQILRGAIVLVNPNGSAPGQWIEVRDRVVVLLPGPPRELQPMFDAGVKPRLEARTQHRRLRRRTLRTTGRSESAVDEVAQPVYAPLRHAAIPIETTILASPGQVELHLSTAGADLTAMDQALDDGVTALARALGEVVFSTDGRSLEQVVGQALREKNRRIAVAESCTGGLMLGRLTDVPGSSDWVLGGVVAYANEVKIRDLDVPAAMIDEQGAVSEPVARAMAAGVRSRFGADVGVAVTGIAGPSGGSDAKPIGTVMIAVAGLTSDVYARTYRFAGDRRMVRRQSVAAALDLVRRLSG